MQNYFTNGHYQKYDKIGSWIEGMGAYDVMKGSAFLRVYKDGSILLTHGGIEMGQGLHTKMIQVLSKCKKKD